MAIYATKSCQKRSGTNGGAAERPEYRQVNPMSCSLVTERYIGVIQGMVAGALAAASGGTSVQL